MWMLSFGNEDVAARTMCQNPNQQLHAKLHGPKLLSIRIPRCQERPWHIPALKAMGLGNTLKERRLTL